MVYSSYILLQPILRLFTRSPKSGAQTVLHALFLPTPFKILLNATEESDDLNPSKRSALKLPPEEVLRPGALYADCGVVDLGGGRIRIGAEVISRFSSAEEKKGDQREQDDDGEYGGEMAGRAVWEVLEERVKVWESEVAPPSPSPPSPEVSLENSSVGEEVKVEDDGGEDFYA